MAKKKIEKVWLFGQTRDYDDSNYEEVLKRDIEAYFDGRLDIPVKVFHVGDYLSINIGLDCGFKCTDDTVPQSIAGILFGISNDYKPEYCFAQASTSQISRLRSWRLCARKTIFGMENTSQTTTHPYVSPANDSAG